MFHLVASEGKVTVRDRLQRLGIIQENVNVCPFCEAGKEQSHLFIQCKLVYKMWARMAKIWDMNFVRQVMWSLILMSGSMLS